MNDLSSRKEDFTFTSVEDGHQNDAALSREERQLLAKQERDIARQFVGGVPWVMVAWSLVNTTIWLSLWPLVMLGVMPLWLGAVIATLNVTLCYLPDHEAQHNNIARKGQPWYWLNELIGYTATIPLVLPYKMAWVIHQQHHQHTNDPALDPDYGMQASSMLGAVWSSIRSRQPIFQRAYAFTEVVGDNARLARAMREAVLQKVLYFGILAALCWTGFALEAFCLWWLPRNLGLTYIQVYLSWAPHHPMNEMGRYRDTRAWKSWLGNLSALGMEYHIIHHLHPTIPLTRTPAAYRALRPILLKRGIRNDGM